MANPPSLVGVWVTSFIGYFPADRDSAWEYIPFWLDRRFQHPFNVPFEVKWYPFYDDPANILEIALASTRFPSPRAVLATFQFNADMTLDARFSMKSGLQFDTFDGNHGTYEIGPQSPGGWGGQILILQDTEPHIRFEYSMVNDDEMNFITSYKKHQPQPESLDELLQTVSGTMRRTPYS